VAWHERILPTISVFAPAIASALAGPAAGLGVNALFRALGVTNEDEAQRAIETMDPETAAKLQAADHQFKRDMLAMNVNLERIAEEGIANARAREIALRDRTPSVIAFFVLFAFVICGAAVIGAAVADSLNLDPVGAGLIGSVLGYLSAKSDTVITYYFGSSRSSQTKTDALADLSSALRSNGNRR